MDRSGGNLGGKTSFVTGATSGIGKAIAEALAEEGVKVGVAARSPERVTSIAKAVGGWGFPLDVSRAEAVAETAAAFTAAAGGPPDILVASAGVFSLDPVEEITDEELARNLDVNLMGSIFTVRAFLPGMKARRSGTIVQVGSVAGRKAFPENGAYSASKFGLRGFHEVLLEELRGTGVRATLLEPAAVDTPIWSGIDRGAHEGLPIPASMLRPAEVAKCVVFLASRDPAVQIPIMPVQAI